MEPTVEEDGDSISLDQSYLKTRNQLIVLGLFPLSEAIAWTSIFPYIYAMVESFNSPHSYSTTDSYTATYAGIMISVFTFGEFIMAPLWARISDRIGRKPTLLVGSVGAMISALGFGFSSSLPVAIAARAFAGVANPNLGVVQTFVGELVSTDHQAKGFSVVPFLRGLGTAAGPVIGGYLAEPVKSYPSLFRPHTIWDRFPYLLPNLIVVMCLMTSCCVCFLLLDEVHVKSQGRTDMGRRISTSIRNLLRGKAWGESMYTSIHAYENSIELITSTEIETECQPEPEYESLNRRLAFTRQSCLQILSSMILGYLKVATLATIPIFLSTPLNPTSGPTTTFQIRSLTMAGGLGLDTKGASNVLLTQGFATIITQILAVPKIIEKVGPLRSYRLALSILACVYGAIPFAAALPQYLGVVMTTIDLWVYALVNGLGTTCSGILWVFTWNTSVPAYTSTYSSRITNTAPSPVYLATINGAAASIGCLARTLGPLVSGSIFQFGINIGNVGLPFWALGLVAAMGLIVATFLRDYP